MLARETTHGGQLPNIEKHWGVSLLFLGDPIATHALTRVVDLAQHISSGDVAGADNADANGNGSPVVTQPTPRGRKHDVPVDTRLGVDAKSRRCG